MLCFGGIVIINVHGFLFDNFGKLWNQFDKINHKVYLLLLFLIFLGVVFGVCFVFRKVRIDRTNSRKSQIIIVVAIFIVSLLTKLIFIHYVSTKQYSDFQLFYWVTNEIANKTPKYLSQSYFSIWAYQVGFPAIMSPIIKVFGTHIEPLIIANCIFMSITNVFIYLISSRFVNKKLSLLCALAFAFFPFALGLSTVYTNQHLATMFFYAGLYLLIYNKRFSVRRSVAAGLLFALGNMARPEAIVIIVTLIGFSILVLARKSSLVNIKANLRKVILPIACTILSYVIGFNLISQFFVVSGLNPNGLANNFPLYKFVIGFNHTTGGTFSKEDADYLFNSEYFIKNPEQRDQEAMGMIKERLSVGIKDLATLMVKKARIMWSCNSTWYPSFVNFDLNKTVSFMNMTIPMGFLLNLFTCLDSIFFILIFAICAISMYISFKAQENSLIQLLLAIFFTVTFLIFFLIEVQHRYSFYIFPALFVLTAAGLNNLKRKAHGYDPKFHR